jgi:hypothetical protein
MANENVDRPRWTIIKRRKNNVIEHREVFRGHGAGGLKDGCQLAHHWLSILKREVIVAPSKNSIESGFRIPKAGPCSELSE